MRVHPLGLPTCAADSIRRRSRRPLGVPATYIRRFASSLLSACISVSAACSNPTSTNACPVSAASDREVALRFVEQIVRESTTSDRSDRKQYQSVSAFLRENSECCFIEQPAGYSGERISFPTEDLQVAIRYRRDISGERPYSIDRFQVGPCLDNYEVSGQALSHIEQQASRNWPWQWRVM